MLGWMASSSISEILFYLISITGVVLERPSSILLEQALKFDFKTSNNQAE